MDLVMIAGRHTLLEQPAAVQVIPECRERGVGVVSAAVFNSGVLAARPTAASRYEYGTIPPDLLDRATRIADLCEQFGVDLPTAALQFPFTEPAVVTVVVGGANPVQVQQNAARMATPVPTGLWNALYDNDLVTT